MIRGLYRHTASVLASPWIRVGGTLLGVGILIHTVDIPKAAASFGHADPRWIAAAFGLTAVAVVASVMEWGVLVRTFAPAAAPAHVGLFTWRRLGSQYLQSLFFTQVLPAGVGGDAVRTVEMGRHVGHTKVLASLAGSRMAGMLGMSVWGLAAAVLLRQLLGNGILAAIAVMAGVIMLIWTGALSADRLAPHRLVARVSQALGRAMHSFTEAFASYRRHPHAVAQCLFFGAAGWGINIFALDLAARSIGIDMSWTVLAVCIPLGLLAALVPFSINGLGVREGVLVAFLTQMGVSTTHAASVSLLVDLQMIPFAVIGGLLLLRRSRIRAVAEPEAIPQLA
ncbi:MAG: flippase-like domain-containing protein [Candidatus Dormibacteraeota bacterium]|nr:flippase-like domain-containing protein [Candidatus Dormibacteraeota bacterium]